MNLNIFTYLCGSFFIVTSLFTFSDYYSDYICKKIYDIKTYNETKKEKINECIYSSIHGLISSTLAIMSVNQTIYSFNQSNLLNQTNLSTIEVKQPDNEMQYLASSLCFSYFVVDLFHCIYHKKYLFIMHHLASIVMLLNVINSFINNQNIGYYVMYNIFLLESNTVLLNIGFLLKEFKFHYSITCMSWIIHLICFVSFRLIMLPLLVVKFYLTEPLTKENLIYIPNFILIISGSVYWSYRQTIGIKKYLKENSVI